MEFQTKDSNASGNDQLCLFIWKFQTHYGVKFWKQPITRKLGIQINQFNIKNEVNRFR